MLRGEKGGEGEQGQDEEEGQQEGCRRGAGGGGQQVWEERRGVGNGGGSIQYIWTGQCVQVHL